MYKKVLTNVHLSYIIYVEEVKKRGYRKMGRSIKKHDREQLHVWVLRNQLLDIKKVQLIRGITKTDAVSEALAQWLSTMRKEGVL